MNQFADWFAPTLLRTSLSLIVASLLVATCVKWMRLRSPGGEQWAWLLVLTQGVMFVWLTVPVPEDWLPQLQKVAVPVQEIVPATLPDMQAVPIFDPPPKLDDPEQIPTRPRRSIEEWVEPKSEVAIASTPPIGPFTSWRDRWPSWSVMACAIWLAGLVAVIAVATARYVAFARRLRGAHPAPADWSHEWRQLCAAAGIHRAIPLVVTKKSGPALCRLPSGYQLVVPKESWALLTSDQRIAIFRHELEHYRRGDVWRLLVVRLLASVHWFNPCSWWAARRYEAQSEFACDAAAAGEDPAAFSELLVRLAAGDSRRITGVQAVAAGSVYERVQRLLNPRRAAGIHQNALPALVATVAMIAAGMRLQIVAAQPTSTAETAAPTTTAQPFPNADPDEILQTQARVDDTLQFISARKGSWFGISPQLTFLTLMGLGPETRVTVRDPDEKSITAVQWLTQTKRNGTQPMWLVTADGARPHQRVELHHNRVLAQLALAGIPASTPLTAYTGGGQERPITVEQLVEHAKRQISIDERTTLTLCALLHYVPFDATWTTADGETWNMERLVQQQSSASMDERGVLTRMFVLALALQKYRNSNESASGRTPSGVWLQIEREINERVDAQPFVKLAIGRNAIHDLRWRVLALPAERLHEKWVTDRMQRTAYWVIDAVRSGAHPEDIWVAVHTLRLYRERESKLAMAVVVPVRGSATEASSNAQFAAADAKPAATEPQAADPPTDVAADELAGVVVDADGKPIADVFIDVWSWAPGNETRTDEQGLFRLKGIDEKRRVEVLVSKEGYTPQHFAQQQRGARGWKIVLSDKTYLEGTITGADGQPAVGAEIRAAFGPVQADGVQIGEVTTIGKAGLDGKYRLYLKPEKYDIQIVAPGQGVKRLSDVVLEDGVAKPMSVTLERGVRFEAHVVDSETGKPVEGFILWQWRAPFLFGRSDADGKIAFDDLVPGATEFNCGGGEPKQYGAVKYYQHGPFGRWWSVQAMQEWERKQIDDPKTGWQRNFDSLSFDLQLGMSPAEIVVERGVTVSGYVTDPEGNAVAGATVAPAKTGSGNSLTGDTRYSEKTGADGKFLVVLPASNAAEYNLTVHDGEYQEWRKWANGVTPAMRTKPGEVIEGLELQLTKPATIRGHVTFGGKPAAGREVRTQSFDKLENRYYDPTTTTDKDGNFELKFVRAGKQYLQVEPFWLTAEQAPKGSRVIEVAPGEVLEGQELVAGRLDNEPSQSLAAAKFQARVVDADGKPVAGASVGLGPFGGAGHYLETWRAHLASLGNAAAAETLPVTGDDGLIELQTQYLVQSRQTTAHIFAVDAANGRAGIVLFDLDAYATIDPNGGPQIVDVPVASLTPTRITLNSDALEAVNLDARERLMLLEIEKDGLPLQRVLGTNEPIEMLLPPGEYAVSSNQWFAERIQTTFQVAATAAPSPVEIELKLSRLGSLIGNPAPEFAELKSPEKGANPSLAQLKGKVVVLDFWGHWCGPCVQSMPNLMTLHDEFKDRGVEFVAVHDDSVESWTKLQPILDKLAKERWNGRAIPFPVVLDGGGQSAIAGSEISVNGMTTATYGIWSWPTTIVIDREGRVNGLISAHNLDSSRKTLEELLEGP